MPPGGIEEETNGAQLEEAGMGQHWKPQADIVSTNSTLPPKGLSETEVASWSLHLESNLLPLYMWQGVL